MYGLRRIFSSIKSLSTILSPPAILPMILSRGAQGLLCRSGKSSFTPSKTEGTAPSFEEAGPLRKMTRNRSVLFFFFLLSDRKPSFRFRGRVRSERC